MITTIYECGDDIIPSRLVPSVRVVCNITVKLDGTFSSLPDYHTPNGRKSKQWLYEVEMVPSGASTEFAVYRGGKKLGSQHVAVDTE